MCPEPSLCEALNELDAHAIVVSQITDMVSENPSLKDDLERIYTDDQSFQANLRSRNAAMGVGRF